MSLSSISSFNINNAVQFVQSCSPQSRIAKIAIAAIVGASIGAGVAWAATGFVPTPFIALGAVVGAITFIGIAIFATRSTEATIEDIPIELPMKVEKLYSPEDSMKALDYMLNQPDGNGILFNRLLNKISTAEGPFRVGADTKRVDDLIDFILINKFIPEEATGIELACALKRLFRGLELFTNPEHLILEQKEYSPMYYVKIEFKGVVYNLLEVCVFVLNNSDTTKFKDSKALATLIAAILFPKTHDIKNYSGELVEIASKVTTNIDKAIKFTNDLIELKRQNL